MLAALAIAGVLALALGARERSSTQPLVPRELVADRRFTASTAGGALLNFAFYGELFFLSLFLQQERGLDALQTGLVFLPQPLLFMAVSPLAGRLVAARGPRPALAAGAAFSAIAAALLLSVDGDSGYALLFAGLALNGLGGGLAIPAVTAGVMGTAPPALAGIASAALNAGRQMGGVLGVAVLGGLATAGGQAHASGMHTALVIAGLGLVAASALAFTLPPGGRAAALQPALAGD